MLISVHQVIGDIQVIIRVILNVLMDNMDIKEQLKELVILQLIFQVMLQVCLEIQNLDNILVYVRLLLNYIMVIETLNSVL